MTNEFKWLKASDENYRMTALYDLVMQDKNVVSLIQQESISGDDANGLISNVIVAVCRSLKGKVILAGEQVKQLNLVMNNANILKLSMNANDEGIAIEPELNAVPTGDVWDDTPIKK